MEGGYNRRCSRLCVPAYRSSTTIEGSTDLISTRLDFASSAACDCAVRNTARRKNMPPAQRRLRRSSKCRKKIDILLLYFVQRQGQGDQCAVSAAPESVFALRSRRRRALVAGRMKRRS